MITVQELRKQGFGVKVAHARCYPHQKNTPILFYDGDEQPLSKGGYTLVELLKDNNTVHGVAKCSLKDQFNRKLGVTIALGRALKLMEKLDAV